MHLRRLGSSSRSGSTVSRISTLVLLATFPILSASCGGDSGPTAPSGGSSTSATVTGILLGVPSAAQANSFLQVAAFARSSNLTTGDITRTATWASSNTQIAVLTTLGGLPAFQTFRGGSVTITASFGGRSASQVVVVQ